MGLETELQLPLILSGIAALCVVWTVQGGSVREMLWVVVVVYVRAAVLNW